MPEPPASRTPPPRLHVLPAARAPVAGVLRRGPSAWFQVLRWRLDTLEVEPGAWMHAKVYPRRSAVSPDGELLCAFILATRPPPFDAYYAVSKLPWLTALAAWRIGSTYAPPCQFHDDGSLAIGLPPGTPPDHGTMPLPLAVLTPYPPSPAGPFALGDVAGELRRGWSLLDERGRARASAAVPATDGSVLLALRRRRPGDAGTALVLVHAGHDFAAHSVEGVEAHYLVDRKGELEPLESVVWADWDARGRLLAATADGALQVRDVDATAPAWSHDLSGMSPDPAPPPPWATGW